MALQAIAPLILTMLLVGVAANLAQVGFIFSQDAFKPDLERLNPLTGLKRIFSGRGLVELLKSLLKIGVIGFVVYNALRNNYPAIVSSSQMSLPAAVSSLSQVAITVGMQVDLAMLVLAAADYLFQRREFEKSLRMTRTVLGWAISFIWQIPEPSEIPVEVKNEAADHVEQSSRDDSL